VPCYWYVKWRYYYYRRLALKSGHWVLWTSDNVYRPMAHRPLYYTSWRRIRLSDLLLLPEARSLSRRKSAAVIDVEDPAPLTIVGFIENDHDILRACHTLVALSVCLSVCSSVSDAATTLLYPLFLYVYLTTSVSTPSWCLQSLQLEFH